MEMKALLGAVQTNDERLSLPQGVYKTYSSCAEEKLRPRETKAQISKGI